jgi:hypothetical protein
MRQVAVAMREGDVVERPEKVDAHSFPREFVFDAQIVRCLDLFRAPEADVLVVTSQKMEEDQFTQAT